MTTNEIKRPNRCLNHGRQGGDRSGLEPDASIVLVSGWSFDSSMWQPLIDGFVARGGNRSQIRCLDWLTFGDWVFGHTDCCAIAKKYSEGNVCWLGWSLGGALILEALARNKLFPRQSVILSASPRFLLDAATGWQGVPEKNWQALRRKVGRSPQAALAGFDSWLGLPGEPGRQWNARVLQRGLDWLAAIDQRDWIDTATTPVHWVFGSDDPLLPTHSWARTYTSAYQQYTLLNGFGHNVPWRQAEDLMNILLAFSAQD